MKIRRVLVANRGAIAVRILRTLSTMNLESVAVFAESDRESLHVRDADHAVSLGEGNASETYLDQEKIIAIALDYAVDAIHPGYGFLSENSQFVRQCESANLIFIGPTANQIDTFGLKHKARELAANTDVPLLPGSELLSSCEEAMALARDIGYPVMLKSTAGGGGIGMQLCRDEHELQNHYDSVARLSRSNFANSGLYIEKFIEHARHIEVQVFGYGTGDIITLGERDCSAQRRNQKVIEESPAPNLDHALRKSLIDVAAKLTAAVNYQSAGTVEFILDTETDTFYFLEVNTRLQVEHGVTEMVYGIDLVRWMVELSGGIFVAPQKLPSARGHAIQVRIYAEDPGRDFQPSAGLLTTVSLPNRDTDCRVDHWIESGITVSAYFDPLLAKLIVHADNRSAALQEMTRRLTQCHIYGIETNYRYLQQLLNIPTISEGRCLTSTLAEFEYQKNVIEVIKGGTMTTVQDYPGRCGYWSVGIPPSGPYDDVSFRIGNRLLANHPNAAGLEMTLDGVILLFLIDTQVVLTGAYMPATLDAHPIKHGDVTYIRAGQTLRVEQVKDTGMRTYLLFAGGINCPEYLGSRATFTLGKFGGHAGRALRKGDVLRLNQPRRKLESTSTISYDAMMPQWDTHWRIHVIPGPQGTNEFFTADYLEVFYQSQWSVHFNSSRTGIRLVGPKPEWARSDGGEAGMHPSNIHDNAYAFGTIDFTGDMPVVLGPDGPSLGGFVCLATVASADRWKLGQLKAGDTVNFLPVTLDSAIKQWQEQTSAINNQHMLPDYWQATDNTEPLCISHPLTRDISHQGASRTKNTNLDITIRRAGDSALLIEFGDMILDIELRFVVQQFTKSMQSLAMPGIKELTPGIRSVQVQYDFTLLSEQQLISHIKSISHKLTEEKQARIPSRIVHLPLSWDDEQCRIAIEKYHQIVRKDAPWYPSNIEFIRRINGLESVEDVKRIVFDAHYLVLGLGDVYLGAPVATPIDPRHRLVTTKYNPARTWTAENSVGIGGSYLCIYGMEGPGGYQFVGRTVQMWNIYRETTEFKKPWLLRYFDQIKFYPVSNERLAEIRREFLSGQHVLKIEETEFDLHSYRQLLNEHDESITNFVVQRQHAFETELDHWRAAGQFQFEETPQAAVDLTHNPATTAKAVESPAAGNVWKVLVKEGETIDVGQEVIVLESMKMEIPVAATEKGVVTKLLCTTGTMVDAGTQLLLIDDQ